VGLALLLHALLLAALMYGWMLFRSPPRPMPTLAIEATVVDARTVAGEQRAAPPPAPPVAPASPPAPQGPPPPSPEERAEREQQRAQERQKAEAALAQQAAEEKAQAQAAQAKAAEESRKAEEQRAAELKRKVAEAKAAQEKKAQEAAQAKEKADEAQEAAEREADLKRSLASEEHAVSSGPALASWQAQIAARINRAWLRPPTARPGIQCMLYVTQEPGGTVTQVKIGDCNGDQAVRESIEAAVYRASPLPPPPDPALFDRNLKINFKPD
jgi:colicin import membrane protein